MTNNCKKCLKNYNGLSNYNISKHEAACNLKKNLNPKISSFFVPKTTP